jgi:hypothetical protein
LKSKNRIPASEFAGLEDLADVDLVVTGRRRPLRPGGGIRRIDASVPADRRYRYV